MHTSVTTLLFPRDVLLLPQLLFCATSVYLRPSYAACPKSGRVGEEGQAKTNLAEAHELEDLARLGVDGVDTPDAHNKDDLGLGLHEEVVVLLGLAPEADEVGLLLLVLLGVGSSLLEDHTALNLVLGALLSELLGAIRLDGLERLALLEHMLGNDGTLGPADTDGQANTISHTAMAASTLSTCQTPCKTQSPCQSRLHNSRELSQKTSFAHTGACIAPPRHTPMAEREPHMICTRRLETRDKISQLEKSHAGSLGTNNKNLDFLGTDKKFLELGK